MNTEMKYKITLDRPDWYEIQEWCEVYIGVFDRDWYKLGVNIMEYVLNGKTSTQWFFREEKHAIMFALKWA